MHVSEFLSMPSTSSRVCQTAVNSFLNYIWTNSTNLPFGNSTLILKGKYPITWNLLSLFFNTSYTDLSPYISVLPSPLNSFPSLLQELSVRIPSKYPSHFIMPESKHVGVKTQASV
jgi:hypothetical protein